jgi:cytochrome b pre-mRNA-processing protein 3
MPLLQSLTRFFAAPAADNAAIAALYGRCVAQARRPDFYRALAVPDTIDGRFDLLVLHVFLVMRRLDADAKQQLFDLMFADMDRNLREMGVGDMGIGKRVKPMIAAFYGRAQAYEKALAETDEALAAALARNLYGKATPSAKALQAMAAYVRRTALMLEEQAVEDWLSGRVEFEAL